MKNAGGGIDPFSRRPQNEKNIGGATTMDDLPSCSMIKNGYANFSCKKYSFLNWTIIARERII